MSSMTAALVAVLVLTSAAGLRAASAPAQIGSILKRAQQVRDLRITNEEETQIGEAVSARIRTRYGVVQDEAVHRYVGLVGAVVAQRSGRAGVSYHFIVLDTDGVNAFAAPGGFVHVTRGALALVHDEAELAGILAHEIVHVAERHTITAIQKGKMIQAGADESLSARGPLFDRMVEKTSELVLAGFGRAEELEADEKGLPMANAVGYSPGALGGFLTRLAERNKESGGKQGLFASHPEIQERIQRLATLAAKSKPAGAATLADRYTRLVKYESKPLAEIAAVETGAAGLAGAPAGKTAGDKSSEKAGASDEQKKKRGFGLANLARPGGGEKKSAEVTGSGAARGVDTERNAKGGPNASIVPVQITPQQIAAFKKEGNLT